MIGFSIPIFFVTFREATEASIVVAVLMSFIHTSFSSNAEIRRQLSRQVWLGTAVGLLISFLIGATFIVVWFKYATNLWQSAEALWEGCFSLLASILLTVMALAFLGSEKLAEKWNRKMSRALKKHEGLGAVLNADGADEPVNPMNPSTSTSRCEDENRSDLGEPAPLDARKKLVQLDVDPDEVSNAENHDDDEDQFENDTTVVGSDSASVMGKKANGGVRAMFMVPFVTVLREGLEGMVFLGGISISEDPGHIPLAAVCGIGSGLFLGYLIFRTGNNMKMRIFFISASVFLCFLSAGLLSKAVGKFELYMWAKALGVVDADNEKSYNVRNSVWHIDCCNPDDPNAGGWQFFNAIFGWTNSASIATVTFYAMYWIVLSILLVLTKLFGDRAKRIKGLIKKRNAEADSYQDEEQRREQHAKTETSQLLEDGAPSTSVDAGVGSSQLQADSKANLAHKAASENPEGTSAHHNHAQ